MVVRVLMGMGQLGDGEGCRLALLQYIRVSIKRLWILISLQSVKLMISFDGLDHSLGTIT